MLLRLPGSRDAPCPLIVPSDAGAFAKALTKVAPGKNVLAFGDLMPWSEYVALWSKITGVRAAFENSTVEDMDKAAPGGFGVEMGEMYAYADEFGYWGEQDSSVVFARDVSFSVFRFVRRGGVETNSKQLGVDINATSIEQYIKEEDWSELLGRPVAA